MDASRRATAAVVSSLLAAVTLLTSCSGYRDGLRPAEVAAPAQSRCPSTAEQVPEFGDRGQVAGAGRLPAGFEPVSATRCSWIGRSIGDAATRSELTMRELRSPSVSTALTAALELPDQEFRQFSRAVCPAVGRSPEFLILVDAAGGAVRPWLPESPCGEVRVEVAEAISDLKWPEHETYQFETSGP